MSTIKSSTGLASGLDLGALVDALINAERAPARRLEARQKNIQATQTGLTQLQAQLLAISTPVQQLMSVPTFATLDVQNSDPTQLTVSTKASSLAGTYQFQTVRLAANHQSISRGFANLDTQQIGSAGDLVIATGGRLDPPTRLDVLNGGAGIRRGVLRITDRSGASADVDLRNAVSVADVVSAINNSTIGVQAETIGGRLRLRDTTGQSATALSVADLGGGHAAEDLGIASSVNGDVLTGGEVYRVTGDFTLGVLNDGNGLRQNAGADDFRITRRDGTSLTINLDGAATLNDVVQKINGDSENNGTVTAALDNGRLVLTDQTGGSGALQVSNLHGSNAADVLGLNAAASGDVLTGKRLAGGLDSVLLRNLRGGRGITQLGEISLTDRTGATAVVDLSSAESLDEVLDAINSATTSGNVALQLRAELNAAGTGLVVRDTSGSTAANLQIADVGGGTLAADLGIAVDAAQNSVTSSSLGLRRVNEATSLATYAPRGGAVSTGSFRIQDSAGNQAVINLTSSAQNIGDVLDRINAATGVQVTARLSDTGDGIVLIDDAGGAGALTVADVGNGRAAADLRLAGTGVVGGSGQPEINARNATVIRVEATDTLTSLASKINSAQGSVRATLVNSGAAVNGARLTLNSTINGAAGRLVIDEGGLGLGFTDQQVGRDAVLRVGGDAASGYLLTSSTNTFVSAVAGLDVTVIRPSDVAATVTTTLDDSKIGDALNSFVTAYNAYVDKAADLTSYDSTTQTRSALQGTGTTLRIETRFNALINRITGPASASVRSLADVGVRLSTGGKLVFDRARLDAAFRDHPDEVKALFQNSANGFAKQFDAALDELNDETTGTLTAQVAALDKTSQQLTDSIARIDAQLEVRRARLEEQFSQMETILSGLQSQQSSLGSLANIIANMRATK